VRVNGFLLAAGEHVVAAGHGEPNTRLDAFYVTSSSTEVPGLAPAAVSPTACDVNGDLSVNVVDVQLEVNQALGAEPCVSDINGDGLCNVVDVQRVVNAALGGACVSP
jgi:hypothetical protein